MSAKLDLRIRNFVKMQEKLWKISCSLLCWLLWIQNYQMTCKYLTSNTTFSKKVNPIKYRIQTYVLWGPGIYYSYILLVYPIRPWNLLNVKKASNLIKVISSYNICSGIKSQQAKKPFVIQYQKQNFSVPFHQVIFDHSVSCVLLIDKTNESCKNSKSFERSTLSSKSF